MYLIIKESLFYNITKYKETIGGIGGIEAEVVAHSKPHIFFKLNDKCSKVIIHKYYIILSNNHYTLKLSLLNHKECKLVIYSMYKYASIIFNKKNTVTLPINIISN